MNRNVVLWGILAIVLAGGTVTAYADTGSGGNAFSWLRDDDGDGIPNGMDEDWIRPEDGTGYQLKHGFGLVMTGLFGGWSDGGYAYQKQYREREQRPEARGDYLRIRRQLRDGSCK